MAQSARSGNGVVSAKWRNVQQFSLCAPRRLPIGDTADYQSALHAGLQGIMRIAAKCPRGVDISGFLAYMKTKRDQPEEAEV